MLRKIFLNPQIKRLSRTIYIAPQIRHFSKIANLAKVQKTVTFDEESKSFSFFGLFKESYLSKASYCLAKELFEYILNDSYLEDEFPIIKQNSEIYINVMVLHVILLLFRINHERNTYAKKEASIFQYYCKSNFYVDFAKKLNDFLPVEDFAEDFIEGYAKRAEIFYNDLSPMLIDLMQRKKDSSYAEAEKKAIKGFLRKNIFLYEVSENDEYLEKLYKYFVAHRNYIMSLSYQELTTNKIFWGFSKDTFLLEQYSHESAEQKSNSSNAKTEGA